MSLAPDYLEPVVGWRLWLTVETSDGVRLRSVFHETEWPAREAVHAACLARPRPWLLRRRSDHAAPQATCRCGLYACEPELLVEYLQSERGRHVFGRVQLWGLVVECEHGWRAEHAYPVQLFVPAAAATGALTAEEIALALAVYGVPVEPIGELSPERFLAAA